MVGIYSSHRRTSHLSFVALSDTEHHTEIGSQISLSHVYLRLYQRLHSANV